MTMKTLCGGLITAAAIAATAAGAPTAQAADTFFGNCAADGDLTLDRQVSWIPGNAALKMNVHGTGRGALNGKNSGSMECSVELTFARSLQGCVGGFAPIGRGRLTVDGKKFAIAVTDGRFLPGSAAFVRNSGGGNALMAGAYGPSAESLTSCTTFQFDRAVMGIDLQTLAPFRN